MQLTTYTDYSLRVLIYLAVHRTELVTIKRIAGAYAISRGHLMKAVHQLGLAGYVETVRGRGGGLRLARDPEQIRIGEVVRRTPEPVSCPRPARRTRWPLIGCRSAAPLLRDRVGGSDPAPAGWEERRWWRIGRGSRALDGFHDHQGSKEDPRGIRICWR